MQTISIPRRDWGSRLDEWSRMHEGWLASLAIMARPNGELREFRQMPLVGVSAEPSGRITIAVAEATGDHLTHTIYSPAQVLLEITEEGAHAALEIDSADGRKAILRFKRTALPETVDGVVHG
jgi:hypothetical protein